LSLVGSTESAESQLGADAAAWDSVVSAGGGRLLQSWHWGAFKERFGWDVVRLSVASGTTVAAAQVLFRRRAGVSAGYIPRGPVVPHDDAELAARLWLKIDAAARRRRALWLIVEPEHECHSRGSDHTRIALRTEQIQPSRTVKISLRDDEALLTQMHQKTRYNVRLAQRRGVTARVSSGSDDDVAEFYRLLLDTADRNAFNIHTLDYYREFLRQFGDDAVLMFADIEGQSVAGLIATTFGDEAVYMYGASSTRNRAHGAGFYIQFEAMRWARRRGCRHYDLWGIPPQDPPTTKVDHGDRIAGTSGNDWRGLYEFKTRFGGEIVTYPQATERIYHPLLASLARRVYQVGG
jgi:lipid II:glycine glycyltransferase (peptidoglycan interpeptide bridge formation enzyme)